MKYTRFRMIMQFSLQCRKKTTCSEQSFENNKTRCFFKYLPQLIDILTSLMSLLPFLLRDSGKDDKERILIFGDATMKNLLNLSNTWLVDGTLKLSPEIIYQIYTIHAELNGFDLPCVYVLLPNKTEKTYIRMIELLSDETNPNPGKTLADLEKSALNAFSKKSPTQKSRAVISI